MEEHVTSREKTQSLQGTFLNAVCKARTPVVVFLVSGVKLQGAITRFDNFCVLLCRNGRSQLVYKHAIATVMPAESVALPIPDDETPTDG